MFYFEEIGGVKVGKFELFSRYGVKHGISTRVGGVSDGQYNSLNIGFSVGDKLASVMNNRRLLCEALEVDASRLTVCNQVHGNRVIDVTLANSGNGLDIEGAGAEAADAMVTDSPGISLQCGFADCVPILLYAPDKHVAAVTHAGWKGTVAGVAAQTAKQMINKYACDCSKLIAGIGPSIGQCCFTVDQPVADCFRERFTDNCDLLMKKTGDKYRIDLWEANKLQLAGVGVLKRNIVCANICTSCNTDLFYSYRKENGKTGRHAAIIAL